MPESESIGRDGLVARDSGIWVEEKLYYLGRYLKIFSVGMSKKWADKLYYVDLFTGPGRCLIRGTQKEIDGSPLIALLGFNFAKYFFFEADRPCHEALEERVKERAPQKVQKRQNDLRRLQRTDRSVGPARSGSRSRIHRSHRRLTAGLRHDSETNRETQN